MATVTYTSQNSPVKLKKPQYIVATEWLDTDTDSASGDSYILEEIERDTTSLSQDDNDTSDIECETSDTPIDTIVTLGKWQVSAECDNLNDDLLVALCGFTKDSTGGNVYAPGAYTDKYIQFDIVYKTGEDSSGNDVLVAMRVPKLKLNAKIVLESLNSDLGNITIAGTAQNIRATVNGKTINSPFVKVASYTLPTSA